MRKVMAFVLSIAVATFMTGCIQVTGGYKEQTQVNDASVGSAESQGSTIEKPAPIAISESGWYASDAGYVFYGVKIDNPNDDYIARFVNMKITGKDSDGKIVFSEDRVSMFALPGKSYYCGGQCGNGVAPATVEFSASVDNYDWVESTDTFPVSYEIGNTNVVEDAFGDPSFTGELTAIETPMGDGEPESDVEVTVVLKDAGGNIVYGQSSYIDAPENGETTSFSIDAYGGVPDYSSYEISAWGQFGGCSMAYEEEAPENSATPSESKQEDSDGDIFNLSETTENGLSYLAPTSWTESTDGDGAMYGIERPSGKYAVLVASIDTSEAYESFAEMNKYANGNDFAAETVTAAVLQSLEESGAAQGTELTEINGKTVRMANYFGDDSGEGYCAAVCPGENNTALVIVTFSPTSKNDEPEVDLFDITVDICGSIEEA